MRLAIDGTMEGITDRAVSWLTISRRLVISWLGVTVTGNCVR